MSNGPGNRTYLSTAFSQGKSITQIINFSGEIDLTFSINVGLEVGPFHYTLFSYTLGPIYIFQFGPQSGPSIQLNTYPTIYITEADTDPGKNIVVHEASIQDPNTSTQTDEVIEVDYPDGTKDYYPVEALTTSTNEPISPNPFNPDNVPYQIVAIPRPPSRPSRSILRRSPRASRSSSIPM